eukprot:5737637-Amphidinium_carterae.1
MDSDIRVLQWWAEDAGLSITWCYRRRSSLARSQLSIEKQYKQQERLTSPSEALKGIQNTTCTPIVYFIDSSSGPAIFNSRKRLDVIKLPLVILFTLLTMSLLQLVSCFTRAGPCRFADETSDQ